jgi:hypothetical protein
MILPLDMERATELRSWVQIPPGPFLLRGGNYGIKLSSFFNSCRLCHLFRSLNVDVDVSPVGAFDLSMLHRRLLLFAS